jgi:hypothetical protein
MDDPFLLFALLVTESLIFKGKPSDPQPSKPEPSISEPSEPESHHAFGHAITKSMCFFVAPELLNLKNVFILSPNIHSDNILGKHIAQSQGHIVPFLFKTRNAMVPEPLSAGLIQPRTGKYLCSRNKLSNLHIVLAIVNCRR